MYTVPHVSHGDLCNRVALRPMRADGPATRIQGGGGELSLGYVGTEVPGDQSEIASLRRAGGGVAANGVVPEPTSTLKKRIDAGERLTTKIAEHLWNNNWSEKLASAHYHWPVFLKFVKARFFRIQTWAAGDWSWDEALEALYKDSISWATKNVNKRRQEKEE